MQDQIIEVHGLTKRFGDIAAVDDLSFTVDRGKVTGFLGPNGSGKTTTIRMVLGLARATAGTATIAGRPFGRLDEPSATVGLLMDGAGAHPKRSGRNHLRALAAERSVPATRIDETLQIVGLADSADRQVEQYSLGMKQRLGLAAALLGEPELLILDEPANGLDPAGVRWLRDFLRSFAAGGGTVFVSSHQLAEISQMADEVIVINKGRLVTQTAVSELTSSHSVKIRTPQIELMTNALKGLGGNIISIDRDRAEISGLSVEDVGTIAARESLVLYELTPSALSLEDAFLDLTNLEGAAQ